MNGLIPALGAPLLCIPLTAPQSNALRRVMMILDSALAADHLILANAGSHAKQAWQQIIARKSADISRAKHIVWVVNSNAARPDAAQLFCNDARYVIFVNRVREGKSGGGLGSYIKEADRRALDRFWPSD